MDLCSPHSNGQCTGDHFFVCLCVYMPHCAWSWHTYLTTCNQFCCHIGTSWTTVIRVEQLCRDGLSATCGGVSLWLAALGERSHFHATHWPTTPYMKTVIICSLRESFMSAQCVSTQSDEHTVCSLRQSSGARPVHVSMYLLLHSYFFKCSSCQPRSLSLLYVPLGPPVWEVSTAWWT